MGKACLATLPDVMTAKDVAGVLGISYVMALRLIRFGGMNYVRIGRAYRVSKQNFTDWLHCSKPMVINFD